MTGRGLSSLLGLLALGVMLGLAGRLHQADEVIREAGERARTLTRERDVAALERATALRVFGMRSLEGILVDTHGGTADKGVWSPAMEGTSLVVFVTPSCDRSAVLLEELIAALDRERVDSARLLVVSLAGDAFAVEHWTELVVGSGAARMMVRPSLEGRPIQAPAVPSVLVWEDGILTDVLVGLDRFAEGRPHSALLTSAERTDG